MKKRIVSLCIVFVVISLAIPAYALDSSVAGTSVRASSGNVFSFDSNTVTQEDLSLFWDLQLGEERIIYEYNDGSQLSIECTNVTETNSNARVAEIMKTTSYTFTDTNFLGIKYTAFKVTLTTDYYDRNNPDWTAGNGFIARFYGVVSDIDYRYTVRWDNAFKSYSPYYCSLGLEVCKSGKYSYVIFSSGYNTSTKSVTNSYGVYAS